MLGVNCVEVVEVNGEFVYCCIIEEGYGVWCVYVVCVYMFQCIVQIYCF